MMNNTMMDAIAHAKIRLWTWPDAEHKAEAVFYRSLLDQVGVMYDSELPAIGATDGKRVMVGPGFDKLSLDVAAGLLAHEARHIYQNTALRCGHADHKLYNIASDLVINEWLKASGFKLPTDGVFLDSPWPPEVAKELRATFKVHETSEEEVYSILYKHAEKMESFEFSEDVREGDGEPLSDTRRKVMVAAAAQAVKAAKCGSMPAWLEKEIEATLIEETPWPEKVRDWMMSVSDSDLSWSHPERVVLANYRMLMPDMYSECMGELVIAEDTSGSMWTEEILSQMSAHISAGLAIVQPEKLHMVYCDAQVNKTEEFIRPTSCKLKMVGGGGTDFRPVFDWVEKNVKSPAGLIYFTDGYGPFPDKEPPYPVLWCIMKGCNIDVPFGRVVEIS